MLGYIIYTNFCNFSFKIKLLELIQESPRAPTPDTESEQPTDTELSVSESKTGSSVTLEQRTPTPETEAELDEAEIAHINSELISVTEVDVSDIVANCI